jgi:LPPG:FO 2-phospho-L-lactate transferase
VIAVLAGGVGAARFLAGLLAVVPGRDVAAIVNTGDDDNFHGLTVCPDIDSITYTLAGVANTAQGWGLQDETYQTLAMLRQLGAPTWFQLGDRDFGTHIVRSELLRSGLSLSDVTAHITQQWGLSLTLLPMTNDRVATRIHATVDGHTVDLAMQEWFVRERCAPPVHNVTFEGAHSAQPAPGVLETLERAERIIVAPSNPCISIGPILAVPGISDCLRSRRDDVVAISPLISGRAVKGPAEHMMRTLGLTPSCVGVAELYQSWCSTMIIDERDSHEADAICALNMQAHITNTLMSDLDAAATLAKVALSQP